MESPSLGEIDIGRLIAGFDRSWERRAEMRAKIGERLPGTNARAKRPNEMLVELLRRRPGEQTMAEIPPVSH